MNGPRFVPVAEGIRMAYHAWGEGGAPMVLLHGGMGSWSHWQRNVAVLAEKFSLVCPDLPGFGASDDIPPETTLAGYAGMVATGLAGIPALEAPFHLVGFSFGGLVATTFAAHSPNHARKLTLLAPSGFGRPPDGRRPPLAKRSRSMSEAELRAVYRHNLAAMMLHDAEAIDEETVTLHRANLESARFHNLGLSLGDKLPGRLARVSCPLQMIWGEHDVVAFPTVADRTARCRTVRPDLELHIIPGAGHWAQYEKPDDINRLLVGFHLGG